MSSKALPFLCAVLALGLSFAVFLLEEHKNKEFQTPLGLPEIAWPEGNPYDAKKAELGRLLFFDKRLSSDGTVSCASCHVAPKAFTDRRAVSIGIQGQRGTRHAPTVINAAYQTYFFWDGRASSLEEQCKGPIANPKEMTLDKDVHEAHRDCHTRIQKIEGYRLLFKEVFGSEKCTIDNIAKAVATFERTVLSGNSPYDRYRSGDKLALSVEQREGLKIFMHSGCAECHSGANFSDGRFYNIGIGMAKKDVDAGRFAITKDRKDYGAFKVPTLREVENTYPYMHDGSLKSLEEVVNYYNNGGVPNAHLNPKMHPQNWSEEEKNSLISFLKALSGEGWQHYREPEQFPE